MSRERRTGASLPVRLSDGLLPGAKGSYDNLSPQEQLSYETALHGVMRMEGIRELGFVPEDYHESDLQHVAEACRMAAEYSHASPSLRREVDFEMVQKMLLLHDIGEVHPRIGDVQPPPDRTESEDRKKRLEPFAGRILLRKIKDPGAREEALTIYQRYQADNPKDATVQMARFIDKAQGTSRVADVVFSSEMAKNAGNLKQMKSHLSYTGYRMLGPAINLLTALRTAGAKQEAKSLVMGEYDRIEKAGHPEIARPCKAAVVNVV